MGRKEAISYSYHKHIDECVIISINDITEKPAKFNRMNYTIKSVLSLFFSDIEYQIENGVLMSEDDATKIKQFIDMWKEKVNTIVVHCYAGISRSSAVACAISKYLNNDDLDIWKGSYYPNSHCYKLMCKEFGFDITDNDIDELREINQKAFEERMELEENKELKKALKGMFKEAEKNNE